MTDRFRPDDDKLKQLEKKRCIYDYNNRYNAENYKNISFRLSYSKESDLIEFLDNFPDRKEFFVTLIRKEIKRLNRKKKRECTN